MVTLFTISCGMTHLSLIRKYKEDKFFIKKHSDLNLKTISKTSQIDLVSSQSMNAQHVHDGGGLLLADILTDLALELWRHATLVL